tara:strand:- start:9066 stop:9644 length:579 start_codon:yes stop_codon:yes gene_type:complete
MLDVINKSLQSSIENVNSLLINNEIKQKIRLITNKSIDVFNKKNKILLCGNGGSAADAQHIASELSGRFYKDRPPLNAQALHVNSSFITAVANDYGYEQVYSRMIEAIGNKGDMLIGISTSGNSLNVINAIKKAKEREIFTVGFTGEKGDLDMICDMVINIPSVDTPRIQEGHILIGHIICQLIEMEMFKNV